MKSYWNLSGKELKAQKVTAVLMLIAVIMSTIMTTVIGQSIGILQSMRIEQAATLNGNRYASFYELTREQSEKLHEDDRLFDVMDMISAGSTPLKDSGLTMLLREYHGRALEMYPSEGKVKEGKLPKHPGEIALPEDALHYLGNETAVGDTISLDISAGVMDGSIPEYEFSADFRLTGILESNYTGYATKTVLGIVGNGTAESLLPKEYFFYITDFKTYDKKEFQNIVNDLASSLHVEERCIQYNWVLLDALGISYNKSENSDTDTGFSFLAVACVLVGALVLFAAGLVIYNIMKISITKRIREYGTLRAVGAERGQVYGLVSLQLLILCGVGIPVGLLLGSFSSKAVLAAAAGVLSPELFMADTTEELNAAIYSADGGNEFLLLVSVLVTLVFAMLAAFPAARYASHVFPTVAIAGQAVMLKGHRKHRKRGRKIRNFEAYYARLNLKRGRGRTVITILSLVMSIAVFVALQSFTSLLDTSSSVQEMHLGDYGITNETIGIPADAVQELQAQEAVEELNTVKLSVFHEGAGDVLPFETDLSVQPNETLQAAGLDKKRLVSYVQGLSEEDRQVLEEGTGCLIKNPIEFSYGDTQVEYTKLEAGDVITMNDFKLRVVALVDAPVMLDSFVNGVQVIVNDEVYDSLTGNDSYSEVYPTLKEGADAEVFENWLDGWCAKAPGTHWISFRLSDAQMEESFERIRMLCWALIIFIGMIGILNIINTVYSNIHTRVNEIGMQRAIGMSTKSLFTTFLWEGAYYGIIASVIGAVLGYICCVFIGAARTDTLQLVGIPFLSIAEASVLSIIACLSATAVPLFSIAKMEIVESIENVE